MSEHQPSMRLTVILVSILCLAGCASAAPREIEVSAFRNFGDFPIRHTRYIGSDEEFHYFRWADSLRSGEWKVRKSAMPFRVEWPVGDDRQAFMTTDEAGRWQPKTAQP